MNKIPIGQTIAFGYAFLVTEFWTVLRICRIPALLLVVVDYLWRRYTLFYAGDEISGAFVLVDLLAVSGVLFVYLLAPAVMAVGVTRAAMGLPLNAANYYFPLGRSEWRMLGAYIQYMMAAFALLLLAGLVSALAFALSGYDFSQGPEQQPVGGAVLLAMIASAVAIGYAVTIMLRLAFFLPSVVVSEDAGLERAYKIALGNIWRVLIVLIGVAGPIVIFEAVFQSGLIYSSFGEGALSGDMTQVMADFEAVAAARPLLWAAYGFVNNVAIMGIVPSTAAFAYMKLKAGEEATPPPRA